MIDNNSSTNNYLVLFLEVVALHVDTARKPREFKLCKSEGLDYKDAVFLNPNHFDLFENYIMWQSPP